MPITDYSKWARICRTEAVATNDTATRAFLVELAQEYETMALNEQHAHIARENPAGAPPAYAPPAA